MNSPSPLSNETPLLAPTFLFRFCVPLVRSDRSWTGQPLDLPEEFLLPHFGELEGRPSFAEIRAAWNESGLFFSARVSGKKQAPWCRQTRMDDSDGLQLFIDTRDTKSIHRAGRFCHRLAFLPGGSGRRMDEPCAGGIPIHRAKEQPKPIDPTALPVRSEKRIDGYLLDAHIPAAALTGFSPEEQPRLGFTYVLVDREFGWQSFTAGLEFPILDDPSLWGTLEMR